MDIEHLAFNLDLEVEECIELIDLFIETGTSDIQKLKDAMERKDADAVARAAHSLKGASASFGFERIYDTASFIEDRARHNQLSDIAESFRTLKSDFDEMVAAVHV